MTTLLLSKIRMAVHSIVLETELPKPEDNYLASTMMTKGFFGNGKKQHLDALLEMYLIDSGVANARAYYRILHLIVVDECNSANVCRIWNS